jgi:hypothetical protein
MMSQREQGVEVSGEEVGGSAPAETCGQRKAGDGMGADGRRKSSASGLYREAVSFNGRLFNHSSHFITPAANSRFHG